MAVIIGAVVKINPSLKELGFSGRAANRIWKEAHREAGQYWFDHFLGRHWDAGANEKYGYQPRTFGWLRAKQRIAAARGYPAGGKVPLLFTGTAREDLRRFALVRSFPSRVTVTMRGPLYITMNPRKAGRPNMGKEVTSTTIEERRKLTEIIRDSLERQIRASRDLPEVLNIT
jgi:hypothetical protein